METSTPTATNLQSVASAVQRAALIVAAIAVWLIATAGLAGAAPGAGGSGLSSVLVPNGSSPPIQSPSVDLPFSPNTPFLKTYDATIDVTCLPAHATVSLINRSANATTFTVTVWGSQDGVAELVDVAAETTDEKIVHMSDGHVTVRHDGNSLASAAVSCPTFEKAPVDPPIFTPNPDPTPVPPPTLPSIGTDAVIVDVVCDVPGNKHDVVVQLTNSNSAARTFDLVRSGESTIEPRTVILGTHSAQMETFEVLDGDYHLVVSVGAVPILDEPFVVDCANWTKPNNPVEPPQQPEPPVDDPQDDSETDEGSEDSHDDEGNEVGTDDTDDPAVGDEGTDTDVADENPVADADADSGEVADAEPVVLGPSPNGSTTAIAVLAAAALVLTGITGVAVGRRVGKD